MNPDFEPHCDRNGSGWRNSPLANRDRYLQNPGNLDILQRDRFELLSAYLDGEVTAGERQQVERWLETDVTVQCLYRRLLKLRQEFQGLAANPQERPSTEQLVKQVFRRLDRRPRLAFLYGGSIAAAICAFALLGQLPQIQRSEVENVQNQPSEELMPEIVQALAAKEMVMAQGFVIEELVMVDLNAAVIAPEETP